MVVILGWIGGLNCVNATSPAVPASFQVQERQITGTVVDENNIPLPGVNVFVENTTVGAVTDFDGNYSLSVPANAAILVFSSLGFETQEIQIGTQNIIDVTLNSNLEELESVIVIGYGTQKKSDVTGSVASISEERLEQLPNNNIAQALQGSIPGISISNNGSGAEGNDVSISVRGRSSINASNSPLVVLDGVIYEGSISDINPNDVNSIEVLKDASSTAIYGSRGANGVILITTKQGKSGEVSINYGYSYGIAEAINIPDILSPEEFYEFKNTRDPDAFTATELSVFEEGAGVDWLDLALRKGARIEHNLSVSGGGDNFLYYVSGSYLDVEGIAINDDFKRYTLRTNLSADLTSWLSFNTNTQLSYVDRSGLDASFSDAFYMNPLTRAYDENGELSIRPWPEDPNFDNPLSGLNAVNDNPRYKVFTNNSFEVKVPWIQGLSYKVNTGVEFTYNPTSTYYGRNTARGFESNGESVVSSYDESSLLLENILQYEREFGNHKLFVTGLYSYQNFERRSRSLSGELFPTDFLNTYQNEVAGVLSANDGYINWNLLSSMLRINYNYKSKYLLTLTARRDGYSAFGKNQKYGIFPSAALAWNIHREAFLDDSDFISNLKLRLSYGQSGNQGIDAYSSLALLNERSYVDNQSVAGGYIPFSLGTPDLSWETSTTANLGFDYGFLNNRISGSVDAYVKNTEDLLLRRSISTVHGSQRNYVLQNIGEVQNLGIELGVNADVVRTDDFTWNAQFTGSYNENEIKDIYGDQKSDTLNQWFVGRPINVNYHFIFDGVYQLNDDLENTPQGEVEAGWAKIKDLNDDGTINADDYAVQGQTDPDFIFGLGNTFSYKGISLYVFLQGMTGATRRNDFLRDNVFDEVRRNTTIKNWWTGDDPTNSFWANDYDANQYGVRIYEDASFLRVKDISLSYVLPDVINDQLRMSQFKVYTTVRNLFTFTNYGGLDPEYGSQRAIPLQREILIGLNLNF